MFVIDGLCGDRKGLAFPLGEVRFQVEARRSGDEREKKQHGGF